MADSEPQYDHCSECGDEGYSKPFEWICNTCVMDYGVDYDDHCDECGGECEEDH